jgi:hypothetical protein
MKHFWVTLLISISVIAAVTVLFAYLQPPKPAQPLRFDLGGPALSIVP